MEHKWINNDVSYVIIIWLSLVRDRQIEITVNISTYMVICVYKNIINAAFKTKIWLMVQIVIRS